MTLPQAKALQHRDILVALLEHLGWLVSWEKSDLAPSQDWNFIGLPWSSRTMSVHLPQDKLNALQLEGTPEVLVPNLQVAQRLVQALPLIQGPTSGAQVALVPCPSLPPGSRSTWVNHHVKCLHLGLGHTMGHQHTSLHLSQGEHTQYINVLGMRAVFQALKA